MKLSKPVLLAIATAGAFAAAVALAETTVITTTPSTATPAGIPCYGINSCKGQSQGQTTTNSCSGKNACKGQGYLITATQQECVNKGGSLTEPTKPMTQSATQPYGQ